MKERYNKRGRRLRFVPLVLGACGTFLGFGLAAMGFAGNDGGIGIVRAMLGLGTAGFGLYGIWDGMRGLARPDERQEMPLTTQFILTDIFGNKSYDVTVERLQEQLTLFSKNEEGKKQVFHLQILPPHPVREWGRLKQISCMFQGRITLTALFEEDDGRYRTCCKSVETDEAEEWFRQFLMDIPDFSGWKAPETDVRQDGEESISEEPGDNSSPEETAACREEHRILAVFGESRRDEHKSFSARDLQLAVEGIRNGKYQKAVLEWGTDAFDIFPGSGNKLMVVWKKCDRQNGGIKFFAKEGTVVQVKFWLNRYLNEDVLEDMNGWNDITANYSG